MTQKRCILDQQIIVDDLIRETDMEFLCDHLLEMFLAYVREYEDVNPKQKEGVVYTFERLNAHLRQIETLEPQFWNKQA